MNLNPDLIRQFQNLHLVKHGEAVSYEVAKQLLIELARLVRITHSRKDSSQSE